MSDIMIYAKGLVHCSVCVPKGMDRTLIERGVNAQNPTGIRSQWEVSDQPFKTGQSNPCDCGDDPTRQHFLMVC